MGEYHRTARQQAEDWTHDVTAQRYACSFCGRGAGEVCRTPSGKKAQHSHLQRVAISKANQAKEIPAGAHVRMSGTTAHVYLPAHTDHIIIGYLEK